MNITRLFNSISFRLQAVAFFLSIVGVGFGIHNYLHVMQHFGEASSGPFMQSLWAQIVAAVVVNMAVGYAIKQIATFPIKNLSEIMRSITQGNLEIEVPYVKEASEIGSMARKVELLRINSVEKRRLEEEQVANKERAEKERKEGMTNLAQEFEKNIYGTINNV